MMINHYFYFYLLKYVYIYIYNSILDQYVFVLCFLSSPSLVVFLPLINMVRFVSKLTLSYFGSKNLNLYQNTILTLYLNVSFNFLSKSSIIMLWVLIITIISFERMIILIMENNMLISWKFSCIETN